jgi:hypothetical protein
MTTSEWIAFVAAMGGWAGVTLGLSTWLHKRRTDRFDSLDNKISAHMQADAVDHKLMNAQIQDMARSVAENYLRQAQFREGTAELRDMIIDMRKEIGAELNSVREDIAEARRRVDELFRNVEWRRGGGS